MKIICIRKNTCSHGKTNLLFLPSNMAAMQNLYWHETEFTVTSSFQGTSIIISCINMKVNISHITVLYYFLTLPTILTWTLLENRKVANPLTVLTAHVNKLFASVVKLRIVSVTKFWLAIQLMPNRFSNPGSGPCLEDLTPAMICPPNHIVKEWKVKSFKRKCHLMVALVFPSFSVTGILLRWFVILSSRTVWIGRGSFQVNSPASKRREGICESPHGW